MNVRVAQFQHEFVEFVPERIEDSVVYISIPYATAIHRCACGCGQEVVTPLSPTDWKVIFNGKTVSLEPSIGNWSFDCQSHYFIRGNRVLWCEKWSKDRIDWGRARDATNKEDYYWSPISQAGEEKISTEPLQPPTSEPTGVLDKICRFWPF